MSKKEPRVCSVCKRVETPSAALGKNDNWECSVLNCPHRRQAVGLSGGLHHADAHGCFSSAGTPRTSDGDKS